jgi:predicted extracellular nuclease
LSDTNNKLTAAFYNLENLFDIYDDKDTFDNDFLPSSDKKWTKKRYHKKLRKLSYAISNIGFSETNKAPAFIGFAEVENKQVIEDLLKAKHLKDLHYSYVHYDSPDERGIDVAFIYDAAQFKVISSEVFAIELFDEDGDKDYTRDILLVTGSIDDTIIHVLVNHWSSRREGANKTEHKRLKASKKLTEIVISLKENDKNSKIIIMGDFNDGPANKSVKNFVSHHSLYNPMATLKSRSRGSLSFRREWNLFDQIIFTTNFFDRENYLSFEKADIFDADFLKLFKGKYKGNPFRTFVGKKYKGGYSDHFPVYIILEKNN